MKRIAGITEFEHVVEPVGSRERAYVYAISSAGAAYAITRACSRGEITECGCDGKIRSRPSKGFEWGGCSEVASTSLHKARRVVFIKQQPYF